MSPVTISCILMLKWTILINSHKPQVVVTGANGFVGGALCAEALAQGLCVRGVTRNPYLLSKEVETIDVGEIDENTNWQRALNQCDVVVHLAARVHVMRESAINPLEEFRRVNVQGTEHLARSAAASGVKRFVYVSSIKVNGEETLGGKSYAERDLPMPQDAYGVSKWEAEQALHRVAEETGLELVIVRPPLVYGAGVKGNFAQLLSVLACGIPLPLASIKNHRDLIYVGNLVDALIACATHSNAAGQTYMVSDGERVSTPDLIRNLANALGKSNLVFPFPISVMRFCAGLLGKSAALDRLTQSLQIDSSKIRKELGWQPPYTMQQGLQATADWYLAKRK